MITKQILLVLGVLVVVECWADQDSDSPQAQVEEWNTEYPSADLNTNFPSTTQNYDLCDLHNRGLYYCPNGYEFNWSQCECVLPANEQINCRLYREGLYNCPLFTDDLAYNFNFITCECDPNYGWMCPTFGFCDPEKYMNTPDVPPKEATLCDLFNLAKYECPPSTSDYFYRFDTTICECKKYYGNICSVSGVCDDIFPNACNQFEVGRAACGSYPNANVFLVYDPKACQCNAVYGTPCAKMGICESVEEVLNRTTQNKFTENSPDQKDVSELPPSVTGKPSSEQPSQLPSENLPSEDYDYNYSFEETSEKKSRPHGHHKRKHFEEYKEIICYTEDANKDGEDDCFYVVEEDGFLSYLPM